MAPVDALSAPVGARREKNPSPERGIFSVFNRHWVTVPFAASTCAIKVEKKGHVKNIEFKTDEYLKFM
jgi:hypothetical protein